MKITVLSSDLKRSLGIVVRGIGTKPQLPILSGILLKVLDGEVSLTSTDLEIGFWVNVPAKIEEEGEIVLPSKLFSELVSGLPVGSVLLSTQKNKLAIVASGVEAQIVGQLADDFPSLPRASSTQIVLRGDEFRKKIDRVCLNAARDATRPVMAGVMMELDGNLMSAVATDGFRLGLDVISVSKSTLDKKVNFILPARSLVEVSKILTEVGDDVFEIGLNKEERQIVFVFSGLEMSSSLVAGEFPPYRQILPNTYSTRVVVGREGLLDAVKRANLFARDNANIIKMAVEGQSMVVMSESGQLGSNVTKMPAESEGLGLTVTFNARYLLDFLSADDGDNIVWETEGELKPSVFKSEMDNSWIQVVMPVRAQN